MNINELYNKFHDLAVNYGRRQSLNRLYKQKTKGLSLKPLSKDQINQIQEYYLTNTGKRVDPKWHQLLYTITGVFTYRYLPFDIYEEMLWKLNSWKAKTILDDKNLYNYMLRGINIPARVLECNNGVYKIYDSSTNNGGKETPKIKAIDALKNISNCIIKPSVGTSSGNGIKSFDTKEGKVVGYDGTLENFLEQYGKNFCIERKVEEHSNLAKLNPTTCNTFRIHTWRNRTTGNIEFVSSFFRCGRNKGGVVDNANAGGITCNN